MISHASIIVPFSLGSLSGLYLDDLAPPGTSFSAFALFIGVAMSITAFPVLARILEDRNMTQTRSARSLSRALPSTTLQRGASWRS